MGFYQEHPLLVPREALSSLQTIIIVSICASVPEETPQPRLLLLKICWQIQSHHTVGG